jgi:hypothetical protein
MIQQNLKRIIAVLVISLAMPGCAANLTPIEVSQYFWTAVQNRDNQAIRKYISSASPKDNDLTAYILPVSSFALGRTVIDKEQAWVDTTVEIAGEEPFSLPIKTVLLQENRQWKVDYTATVASISSSSNVARILGSLNDLGIQFADKLNRSLGEIQKTLPEVQKELEKIEESMKQKLPELQQRMEEFMRQLEEALGNKPGSQPPPRTREI